MGSEAWWAAVHGGHKASVTTDPRARTRARAHTHTRADSPTETMPHLVGMLTVADAVGRGYIQEIAVIWAHIF